MKIALAALEFKTNTIEFNKHQIISTLHKYSNEVDMVVFGESFLQGFEALSWQYERDKDIALEVSSDVINDIRQVAKQHQCAVSFGFIEKQNQTIYSSQLTIDKAGQIINHYQRLSTGWKEAIADEHYCEGKSLSVFEFMNKRFLIGLCGDFWHDEIVDQVNQLKPDVVLWPVYCDYSPKLWNTQIKYEYALQSQKINKQVLLVNSVCLESEWDELSKGGAVYFCNGEINCELPSGHEGVLVVSI